VEEEDINMANTFKFGNENWAVKDGKVLAYNDENNAFKPLPFTFARSSSATRVDNEGLIKTTDSGFARIDFLTTQVDTYCLNLVVQIYLTIVKILVNG
tara:strand:- start:285 stop:578 length:294 start_codon:yes stop_codon:yes gene_type:complete